MTIKFERYDYRIPTWAICPLEYGDVSGLSDEDEELLNEFVESLPGGGHWDWRQGPEAEPYFTKYPDIGYLASDVIDAIYWVHIEVNE